MTATTGLSNRVFRLHGILVVEQFDANECYEHAPEVVEQFLTILSETMVGRGVEDG